MIAPGLQFSDAMAKFEQDQPMGATNASGGELKLATIDGKCAIT